MKKLLETFQSLHVNFYLRVKYHKAMICLYSGIQLAFQRRREYQLSDSVQYFLDNLEKTNRLDYVPDQNDVLHARKATKEIVESNIKIDGK